jgi:di/tricarboxylate transporter
MRLVDNARAAWRWASVQVLAVLAVLPLVWAELPEDIRSMVPHEWQPWVLSALALAGIVGRLVKQGPTDAT